MKTPMNIYNTAMKKKKNRKDFSLVELIVVLVIMAILVAALVPSLVGYIRQARQSNSKDECASAVQAAQTIASSAYASSDKKYVNNTSGSGDVTFTTFSGDVSAATNYLSATLTLAELNGSGSAAITKIELGSGASEGIVTKLVMTASNGDTVTYDTSASPKYSVSAS